MEKSTTNFGYSALRQTVYELKEKYPFAGYSVCARSWGGRALFTLSLGNRENAALYVGGFSGCDTVSVRVLLHFFSSLCGAYEKKAQISGIKVNDIFETKGIVIVPCANPDGMEIHNFGAVAAGCYAGLVKRVSESSAGDWHANARGVDLNLNFSGMLNRGTSSAPAPAFYAGKVPESEPETRSIVKLCRSRDIRHVVVLEQAERDAVIVRSGSKEPQRAEMMAKIFCSSSGCEQIISDSLSGTERGFLNRFSSMFGRPSFSFLVGGEFAEAYRRYEEALVLSAIM